MNKIVIIGASGHGKVIADILEKMGDYKILGFLDSFKNIGTPILSYRVLGTEKQLPQILKKEGHVKGILAIGDNYTRMEVVRGIKEMLPDFEYVNAIHPSAVLSPHIRLGMGNVVTAGAIINPDAELGNFCIVNTKSSIGHDVVMEDFSSVAPGVTIGGHTRIGKLAAISIGAIVTHDVSIGENSVVGAASLVLKDIPKNVSAFGRPVDTIRERKIGEPYL